MKKIFLFIFIFIHIFGNAQGAGSADTLSIYISDYDWQKLDTKRSVRLTTGDISQSDLSRSVPCVIGYNGSLLPGNIKLKGDRKIHYEDGNVSFRVELSGENTILKMKRFSLQKPRSKNYVYESLFHKALIREKLIGLRYVFIRVFLNHQDQGIYALEEFMDVNLIESSRRRGGPILHLSEDKSWYQLNLMDVQTYGSDPKDSAEEKIYAEARQRLTDFKNGGLQVGKVFDRKKLGDFFALTDILGFHHAAAAKNVRYYLNPTTEKMEPIGFDGHYGAAMGNFIAAEMGIDPEVGWLYREGNEWFSFFFSNPKTFDEDFLSDYMSSLKRMSKKEYLDSLFADLDPSINNELAILKSDNTPLLADHITSFGPDTFHFSKEKIYERQAFIRKLLANKARIKTAFISHYNEDLKIGIRNTSPLPVKLISVNQDGKRTEIPPSYILLPSRQYISDSVFSILEIHVPGYDPKKGLSLEYKVLGLDDINVDTVRRQNITVIHDVGQIVYTRNHDPDAFHKYYSKYPFIIYNDTLAQFEIIKGKWVLKNPESIPKGYRLVMHEGAELDLQNHAFLVIYSPVEFKGTQQKPVKIFSSDGSGGIFIDGGGRKCRLEYVEFNNMAPISEDTWKLTGAVTFNESPVDIVHCTFSDAKAEDALNLIRSPFTISNSTFRNTQSDALDLDFSDGTVTDCIFTKCANDGIDGSGSKIHIANTMITGAGDKGISSGESSIITAINCTVSDSKVGFGSKDQSTLVLTNCTARNCTYGLAAFQKKSKFGPARITASGVKLENVKSNYLIEERSSLIFDNKPIDVFSKNVRFILYDIY